MTGSGIRTAFALTTTLALGACAPDPEGELTVGAFLPLTGNLDFLAPAQSAAIDLAMGDIRDAGGVLRSEGLVVTADSSDTPDAAALGAADLIEEGVQVVIGPLSSGIAVAVMGDFVEADVAIISPANTKASLTDADDDGLYFRTAPSDALQGQALAELILQGSPGVVGILAIDEEYGTLLSDVTKARLEAEGASVTVEYHPYNAESFADDVGVIAAIAPDAVAVIAFDETVDIIPQMVTQGIGPADVGVYFTDGNLGFYEDALPRGTLTGTRGILPGGAPDPDFEARLLEVDDTLEQTAYAATAYDAVVLAALASIAARSHDGPAIAGELVGVSGGGTECTDFASCKALLRRGEDIDYEGVSGPIDFSAAGDPSRAYFGIATYDATNNYEIDEFIEAGE